MANNEVHTTDHTTDPLWQIATDRAPLLAQRALEALKEDPSATVEISALELLGLVDAVDGSSIPVAAFALLGREDPDPDADWIIDLAERLELELDEPELDDRDPDGRFR